MAGGRVRDGRRIRASHCAASPGCMGRIVKSLVKRSEVIGFNFDIVIDEMNDVLVDF